MSLMVFSSHRLQSNTSNGTNLEVKNGAAAAHRSGKLFRLLHNRETTEKLNTTQQRAIHRPPPARRGPDKKKATKTQ